MFWLLVKKHLQEIFRYYFVDRKTGKSKKKGSTILFICLYAYIFVVLFGLFFALAFSMGFAFLNTSFSWLYFAIMAILSLALGIFGSAFSTNAIMYKGKDNELLFSLPIKNKDIVLSRGFIVFLFSLLYSACAWLPGIVGYILNVDVVSPLSLVYQVLLMFLIALITCAFSCVLGYIVALVSTRAKGKNFITVLVTCVFIFVYYSFVLNSESLLDKLINNGEAVSNSIKEWGQLVYQIGLASTGNTLSLLLIVFVSIVLVILCTLLISKTFNSLLSKNVATKTKSIKYKNSASTNISLTLFKKELKRFTSSSLYMTNGGIGIIIIILLGAVAIFKKDTIFEAISYFNSIELPFDVNKIIPIIISGIISIVLSMDAITTPSMSLEGKNIWIYKNLPIDPVLIYKAKEKVHVLLNGVASIISAILFGIALNLNILEIICVIIYCFMFSWLCAGFGLIIGSLNPNFAWSNEAYPIKQDVKVLFSMLFGFLGSIILAFGCYLLSLVVDIKIAMIIVSIIMALIIYLYRIWYKNKGTKLFMSY